MNSEISIWGLKVFMPQVSEQGLVLALLQDSRLVVEKYKSGFTPPSDIPFEDLSSGGGGGSGGGSDTASVNGSTNSIPVIPGSAEKRTILGTITGGRVKKRSGLLGLFANSKVGRVRGGRRR